MMGLDVVTYAAAVKRAKKHTDEVAVQLLEEAKAYTDEQIAQIEPGASIAYVDTQIELLRDYTEQYSDDNRDAAIDRANDHTDHETDQLKHLMVAEASARAMQIDDLVSVIELESSNRQHADTILSERIDAIQRDVETYFNGPIFRINQEDGGLDVIIMKHM